MNKQSQSEAQVNLRTSKWVLIARISLIVFLWLSLNALLLNALPQFTPTANLTAISALYFGIFFISLLFLLITGIHQILHWYRNIYIIGNDQIIHQQGFFWLKRIRLKFPSLDKITIHKTTLGKLLNYGNLKIISSETEKSISLLNIPNPKFWAKYIEAHFPGPERM